MQAREELFSFETVKMVGWVPNVLEFGPVEMGLALFVVDGGRTERTYVLRVCWIRSIPVSILLTRPAILRACLDTDSGNHEIL
jgi:hypothetical protein